jgi:serine/threonine protein kinase
VFAGEWNSFRVALKCVKHARDITFFVDEIKLLKSLRHPGIIQIFGLCELENEVMAVMEYCEKRKRINDGEMGGEKKGGRTCLFLRRSFISLSLFRFVAGIRQIS